tara:strand:- start:396 stop:2294 length:1899 start_codon:yes stop_codon:yes gene_type:complete
LAKVAGVKRFSFLASLILAVSVVLSPRAAGPDDEFIRAYILITQADNLAKSAQNSSAAQKYQQALNTLNALKAGNPNWKTGVINFRIDYINKQLKSLNVNTPTKPTAVTPKAKPASFDAETAKLTINDLQRRIEVLTNDLLLKESKLKEALSAVPSADETKRLAKLESDLAALKQENTSLKTSVDAATTQLKSAQDDLAKAQDEATKATSDLAKAQAKADEATLALNNAQDRIKAAEANASDKEIKRLQETLATRQSELDTATGELTVAKASVASLEDKLKSYDKGTVEKDLEAQVASLEKQLDKSQGNLQQITAELNDASAANSDLENQLKSLEKGTKEKELNNRIKSLEKQLAKANRVTVASGSNQPRERRSIRDLFNFRGRKRVENAQVAELQNQVKTLRARLEILDATEVPYTSEELELLSDPKVTSAPENTLEARLASIPSDQVENFKAGEAQLFKDHQYAEAEAKFMHILKLDENNALTLSTLAIAQMEQNKYDEAEASLNRAIEQNEEDPHALRGIGFLHYRKEEYEAARDTLAKAASLMPNDAATQHFLGITLQKLNQPKAAETALRRSVQLAPGRPNSHFNLAVVYSLQKPPFTALAKFHYNKALQAGHQKSAELEKLLNGGN